MGKIVSAAEYDYNSFLDTVNKLQNNYDFIKVESIGKSVFGREIPSIKIGKSNEYVLYVGAFHGTERITSTLLMMFAEELCEAIKTHGKISEIDAVSAMFGRGVIIVPRINPDGCEISIKGAYSCGNFASRIIRICGGDTSMWNANARGVDINHNFDAGWQRLHEAERKTGIYGPSPRQYGGEKPNSEPETVALVDLCRFNRIRHAVAFHSQGEVIYWDYGDKTPAKSKRMAEIMAASSGYALDVPHGLALGGGFKDWFIEKQEKPAFTVEVGKGKNPLDAYHLNKIYSELCEMLTITLFM